MLAADDRDLIVQIGNGENNLPSPAKWLAMPYKAVLITEGENREKAEGTQTCQLVVGTG